MRNESPVNKAICAPCEEFMGDLPVGLVDMVFGSPPYENARLYGDLGFKLRGQDWVNWMVNVYQAAGRITNGPVIMVVNGLTRQFNYSLTPERLCIALADLGWVVRKPIIWHNTGVPGSGGPDYFRKNYHTIVVASTEPGPFEYVDTLAWASPVKNERKRLINPRKKDGSRTPVYKGFHGKKANPGLVWHIPTGGGSMGSLLAHENEAPFPQELARRVILNFCPPGGVVYDPFGGSGTTAAAAIETGRNFLITDIREDQCRLINRRIEEARGLYVRHKSDNPKQATSEKTSG